METGKPGDGPAAGEMDRQFFQQEGVVFDKLFESIIIDGQQDDVGCGQILLGRGSAFPVPPETRYAFKLKIVGHGSRHTPAADQAIGGSIHTVPVLPIKSVN